MTWVAALLWCVAAGVYALPSNGTVFAAALQAPNLGAPEVLPLPRMPLDPLVAGRVAHWRCRYENGRLAELSRRDAEGNLRPMRPPQFEPPQHGYLFEYAHDAARPVRIIAPHGVAYRLHYDRSGRLREIACTAPRMRRGVPWTHMRISYRNGRVESLTYWHGRTPSHDLYGVHGKRFSYDARGYMESVRYVNARGELRPALTGIARVTFERGTRGEWLSVTYWSGAGTRTADWFGVAHYRFTYTSEGRVAESATFDAAGAPVSNAYGAYRIQWQYDAPGNLIGARGYALGDILVYDGRPLMPELFDRTFAEAVIQRARDELAPPFWQLADYSDLQRACRRWHSRCADARPSELPRLAEQARVLLEYLMQARAGTMAMQAAFQAHALGLRDPRLLQRAVLGTGVVPYPESTAARTLLGIMLQPMPSNTLFVCGTDITYLLGVYATGVRGVRADVRLINQNMLADTTYVESLRGIYDDGLWLPSVADIRGALQREMQRLSAQRMAAREALADDDNGTHLRIRGRESVARINVLLLDALCRSNAMTPLAVEEGYDTTALYERMTPRGPLFWYAGDVTQRMDGATALAWWEKLARGSAGWPRDAEWQAVRRVLARACATQASYFWQHDDEHTATQAYHLAMSVDAQEPEAYVRYAATLLEQSRYADAARVAAALRTQLPHEPAALALAQRCDDAYAHARELAEVHERLRAMPGGDLSNLLRQVELQDLLGQRAAAHSNAAVLVTMAHERVDILEGLVAYYNRHGDADALERCLALLTRAQPQEFRHWVSRAAVAFARGAPEDGVACLRQAAALDKLRVRRMLTAQDLLPELRASGQTNLVRELQQLIAP